MGCDESLSLTHFLHQLITEYTNPLNKQSHIKSNNSNLVIKPPLILYTTSIPNY